MVEKRLECGYDGDWLELLQYLEEKFPVTIGVETKTVRLGCDSRIEGRSHLRVRCAPIGDKGSVGQAVVDLRQHLIHNGFGATELRPIVIGSP